MFCSFLSWIDLDKINGFIGSNTLVEGLVETVGSLELRNHLEKVLMRNSKQLLLSSSARDKHSRQ